MITRRTLAALAASATIAVGLCSCGAKAAPDIDPAAKSPEPSSTTSPPTTAPTTTTTVDPGTLPQTEDRPDPMAPELTARMEKLFQAIVSDDPSVALPAFFPLAAYQQVKDLKDPVGDWNKRLVGAYNNEIHAYHKQLATQLASAKAGTAPVQPVYAGLDIPAKAVQWIKPGVEYNKIGYFRVFDSKLKYQINGKAYTFNLKSLISWRGQFYVVHLASI